MKNKWKAVALVEAGALLMLAVVVLWRVAAPPAEPGPAEDPFALPFTADEVLNIELFLCDCEGNVTFSTTNDFAEIAAICDAFDGMQAEQGDPYSICGGDGSCTYYVRVNLSGGVAYQLGGVQNEGALNSTQTTVFVSNGDSAVVKDLDVRKLEKLFSKQFDYTEQRREMDEGLSILYQRCWPRYASHGLV